MRELLTSENIGIVFQIIITVVILGMVFYSAQKNSKKRKLILQPIAQKYNGIVKAPFYSTNLEFSYEGLKCRLDLIPQTKNTPAMTRITCRFPEKIKWKIKVYPETFEFKLGKKFGLKDIQVYNEPFDSKFIIQGSDINRVRSFLTPETQQSFMQLPDFQPKLTVDGYAMVFLVGTLFEDTANNEMMVEKGFFFARRIREAGY